MSTSTVMGFYDDLAQNYHLNYLDWERAVGRNGEVLTGLITSAGFAPDCTVLDCSCGIGTQAIGLARAGFHVTGTDLSPASIERAKREATAFQVSVDFQVADFRRLEDVVADTFDVVITCDNSIPHLLTDDDLLMALRSMHGRLVENGLLVIGIRDYDDLVRTRPRSTPPQVIDGVDGRQLLFQVWDWDESGAAYDLSLFVVKQDGENWTTECHRTRYRALQRNELELLATQVGFTDLHWHTPQETGHHQPLLTCLRRGSDRMSAP